MGSDSPLQVELLSYLMFDPDFLDAAAALGRREAQDWLGAHPDLCRLGQLDPPSGSVGQRPALISAPFPLPVANS